MAVTLVAAGQKAPAARAGDRGQIARAVDTVLKAGLKATMPPHVSDMLGIASGGKECPVAQRFERNGKLVLGFNVSTTNKNDIVIFVTDEGKNEDTYYLTSPLGRLRRVLAVKEGTGNLQRPAAKEKAAFEKELRFWLDRIVPARTSK
jgi:hypothetical protein